MTRRAVLYARVVTSGSDYGWYGSWVPCLGATEGEAREYLRERFYAAWCIREFLWL